MKFSKVIPMLVDEFQKANVDFSLIGGVAMYFSGTARTTFDLDFLTLLVEADKVEGIMTKLGYKRVHHSEDVAQYRSENTDQGQVDFLFAHRKYATAMLQRAEAKPVFGRQVKVLKPEDLIGLKVQSSSNDSGRASKDMADIEELIKSHAKSLDWELVGQYFQLFNRAGELDQLKKRLS